MNINKISFKGTYSINNKTLHKDVKNKICAKEGIYNMEFVKGNWRNSQDILFIHTPDSKDKKLERLLSKLKVPYIKINEQEALSPANIFARTVLSKDAQSRNLSIVMADTTILDMELRKNRRSYVGHNGKNGIDARYHDFINYLKTNQTIEAPEIYLRKRDDGEIVTKVYDGRHRIAVFRDMGFKEIPVAIDEKSFILAQEIGLL